MTPISTIAELESLYPAKPVIASTGKEMDHISEPYAALIKASPFLALASTGPEGMDCSPRGDGTGFVRILDEKRIAIPDRRGNNRLDTLRNIVRDPRVALLFLIPGWNECLRINGTAIVTADSALLATMIVDGKCPASAVVVTIETMYFQCARAIKRADLWNPDRRVKHGDVPTAGELLKSAMAEFDDRGYDADLQARQAQSLY